MANNTTLQSLINLLQGNYNQQELDSSMQYMQSPEGQQETIDTAMRFAPAGMMKVGSNATSVAPGAWNTVKNIFTEPTLQMQAPLKTGKNINYFTPRDLTKFPIKRYTDAVSKDPFRRSYAQARGYAGGNYKTASEMTPAVIKARNEVALANKLRTPVTVGLGGAAIIGADKVGSDIYNKYNSEPANDQILKLQQVLNDNNIAVDQEDPLRAAMMGQDTEDFYADRAPVGTREVLVNQVNQKDALNAEIEAAKDAVGRREPVKQAVAKKAPAKKRTVKKVVPKQEVLKRRNTLKQPVQKKAATVDPLNIFGNKSKNSYNPFSSQERKAAGAKPLSFVDFFKGRL